MTIIVHRQPPRRRLALTLLVWAVLSLIAWLDRHSGPAAHHAAVFSFLITAFGWLASALGAVGGAIATSLEAVVGYLLSVVSWLVRRVANVVLSTGSIFAKAWHGIRLLWGNIIRPVVQWLDTALRRVESWLRRTFAPVFRFFRAVRAQLDAIYRRFFQPVLDSIALIRNLNRVFEALHIHVLSGLDEMLARVEQKIEEPFLWVYSRLNLLTDWVNRIVDGDGLFQRLTLIRSLERDVLESWRILFNARAGALTNAQREQLKAKNAPPSVVEQRARFLEALTPNGRSLLTAAERKTLDEVFLQT